MPVVGLQLLKLYRNRKPAAISRNTTKARAGTRSAYGAANSSPSSQRPRHWDHVPAVVEWRLEAAGNERQARISGLALR